jgi:hypothetical protein
MAVLQSNNITILQYYRSALLYYYATAVLVYYRTGVLRAYGTTVQWFLGTTVGHCYTVTVVPRYGTTASCWGGAVLQRNYPKNCSFRTGIAAAAIREAAGIRRSWPARPAARGVRKAPFRSAIAPGGSPVLRLRL